MFEFLERFLADNGTLLAWVGACSAALLVGSAAAVPFLLARLPADHYAEARDGEHHADLDVHGRSATPVSVMALAWRIVRNPLGAALLLAGIAMLVLPGQGILTILAGLAVLRFPGKRRFERWMIGRPPVLKSVNWLRSRHGQPPLEF